MPDPYNPNIYPPRTKKLIPREILKVVASSATPEPIYAESKYVRRVVIYGCKDLSRTPNTGVVYIGSRDSRIQNVLPYDSALSNGTGWSTPNAEMFDLKDLYVEVATNGDGVVVEIFE